MSLHKRGPTSQERTRDLQGALLLDSTQGLLLIMHNYNTAIAAQRHVAGCHQFCST